MLHVLQVHDLASLYVPNVPLPSQALKLWWGYVRLEANATCMTLQSVSDEDGRVVDSLVLRKPEGWGQGYMKDRAGDADSAERSAERRL